MGQRTKTLVIALGGNAILQAGQPGAFEEQSANIDASCGSIARLVDDGCRVVITHGNGPQVGNILIQNEAASAEIPPMPMDACGAESQGLIGYMLERSLDNRLRCLGREVPVCALLTETEVDPADPAFASPSKPVGPFYSEDRAKALVLEKGYVMHEDAGRGWRRVVPSPDPKRVVQSEVVRSLLRDGVLVICSGGGGIPVARDDSGAYHGVEAVVDKDLAASVLAADVGADVLMMLTDVEKVYLHYRTPGQTALHRVSVADMTRYLGEGHFKAGSMGPKVDAGLRFARGGGLAMIAHLQEIEPALRGETGTWIVPDADRGDG